MKSINLISFFEKYFRNFQRNTDSIMAFWIVINFGWAALSYIDNHMTSVFINGGVGLAIMIYLTVYERK